MDLAPDLGPDELGEQLGAPAAALDEIVRPVFRVFTSGLTLPGEIASDVLHSLSTRLGEVLAGFHISFKGFLRSHASSI